MQFSNRAFSVESSLPVGDVVLGLHLIGQMLSNMLYLYILYPDGLLGLLHPH